MPSDSLILDASNNALTVTNLLAGDASVKTLGSPPLGTADGTATGELCAKVKVVGGGSSSGPAGGSVTVVSSAVGASASGSIPIGAKGWTFTVLTGTATFNGVASLPAGFSESDTNTLAAAIAYSTASASSAYVRYNT